MNDNVVLKTQTSQASLNYLVDVLQQFIQTFAESDEDKTESRRLFHGRGRCFPGLEWCNVDWFSPVILITLYEEPSTHWLQDILNHLELSENSPLQCVLVQKRYLPQSPFDVLWGAIPSPMYARRGDLRFHLDFGQQNIGYFLDIEPLRQWLETQAKNCSILNLFAYTCAFSVVAKAAGAERLVNIDMSRKSLQVGRHNHQLNALGVENVKFLPHDIFKSWGKLKRLGPYDIVICDPPSFQKGSFIARKDYTRVLARMSDLVNEEGYCVTCLNAPEVSHSEFMALIRPVLEGFTLVSPLPISSDFPESDQTKGLKMFVFQKKH